MARLWTGGMELRDASPGGSTPGPDGGFGGTTAQVTVDTSFFRSGSASVKMIGTAALFAAWGSGVGNIGTTVLARPYYSRAYLCFSALPSTDAEIACARHAAGGPFVGARLTTAGKLQLWNIGAGTQIGSDSAATIVADSTTWYRVELQVTIGTGSVDAAELLLDGVSVASTTGANFTDSLINQFQWGWVNTLPGATCTIWADDMAVNDNQGASQTTWPGSGNVTLLIPTATSAAGTGWRLGTNTAEGGNGWNSVNNEPPVGVADLAVGSDPKQIRNATANANDSFDTTMTTYTAAGIMAGSTVKVVDPIIATAAPVSTSAKQGTVGVVSNPTIANIALAAGGTSGAFWSGVAAGTYPTGWKWSHGTVTYNPSVTLGTAPVMRVTQVTSSTRIAMVCFMGMYVEYGVNPPIRSVGQAQLQAVNRAGNF